MGLEGLDFLKEFLARNGHSTKVSQFSPKIDYFGPDPSGFFSEESTITNNNKAWIKMYCYGMTRGSLVLSICRVTDGLTKVDYIKPLFIW